MRIALISDIHGNLIAFDIVLADIESAQVDQIICLGDVAADGPQPREVIARLQAIGRPVVLGNTDADLLQPLALVKADDESRRFQDIERWAADQLTAADLAYVRSFQPTIELSLAPALADNNEPPPSLLPQGSPGSKGDMTSLLCFHGSPRSNTEVIEATTSESELAAILAGQHATILAGGHTHTQLVRRYRDMLIINPGSVGLPFEQAETARNPAWAEYAILTADNGTLGIELRRVPVDVAAIRRAILASGMPHAEWLAKDWR